MKDGVFLGPSRCLGWADVSCLLIRQRLDILRTRSDHRIFVWFATSAWTEATALPMLHIQIHTRAERKPLPTLFDPDLKEASLSSSKLRLSKVQRIESVHSAVKRGSNAIKAVT